MIYRMYGDTVQLLRYKVTYETTEQVPDENGELSEQTVTQVEYCISDEHLDRFVERIGDTPHTVETVDQTGNKWIDGREFKDASLVPKAIEMGEIAYTQFVNSNNAELQTSLYITDLDYRMLLLEWGSL